MLSVFDQLLAVILMQLILARETLGNFILLTL